MWRSLFRSLAPSLAVAALAAAPVAVAEEPGERHWTAEQIAPGPGVWDFVLSATTPGTRVGFYRVPGEEHWGLRARVSPPSGPATTQDLDDGGHSPALDGSPAGGAVAAWHPSFTRDLRIAELAPGESEFGPASEVPGAFAGSYTGPPLVRVSEAGAAVVVYLGPGDRWDEAALFARYRAAGDEFGPPERVTASTPQRLAPSEVALAPDGTAILGYSDTLQAMVATRSPDGAWSSEQLPQAANLSEYPWKDVGVGVDAVGNVVAAWFEPGPPDTSGSIRLAFRRPGGRFGEAVDSKLRSRGRFTLGVSLIGEVVLVAETAIDLDGEGYSSGGIQGVMGNARTQSIGVRRRIAQGNYPWFAMNSRGNAIAVYEDCCPMILRAVRRAPLGPFGDPVDIQPSIEFEGARYGRWPLGVHLDVFGNATAASVDTEPSPHENYLIADGPLIDTAPGALPPLDDYIAPVVNRPPDEEWQDPESWESWESPRPQPPSFHWYPNEPGLRRDRQPPRLHLRLVHVFVAARRRLVAVRARCNEPCVLRLRGRIAGLALGPVQQALEPGSAVLVRMRLTRSEALHIRDATKQKGLWRYLRLTGFAADSAGNVRSTSLSRFGSRSRVEKLAP